MTMTCTSLAAFAALCFVMPSLIVHASVQSPRDSTALRLRLADGQADSSSAAGPNPVPRLIQNESHRGGVSSPSGSRSVPFRQSVTVSRANVTVYGRLEDLYARHFTIHSVGWGRTTTQAVELNGGWRLDPDNNEFGGRYLMTWPGGRARLVIVIVRLPSGDSNIYAPAIYMLRRGAWHLMNPDLSRFMSDDYGGFFLKADRLYVYNGALDGGSRDAPQTFRLACFQVRSGRIIHLYSRRTKHKYDPAGSLDPLAELGINR